VALASGKVYVFSLVLGPLNLVNPFPVPPKVDAMTPLRFAVPSNEFP
jgi:hypothetical protein